MYQNFIKPFFDFLIALLISLITLPIFIIIYLFLRFGNASNPLFFQERPGKNEQIFKIVKFKTMTDETDAQGHLLPDDDRMTSIGRFLRKTSLDELPQLFNVLKGDMSFVGPRPLRVRYLPYYTTNERKRHSVRPGITGLAQISGRNGIDWDKRLELDIVYVENISFLEDCKILLSTMLKVFDTKSTEFSEGPDSLDEHRGFVEFSGKN
ncbi:sugar transferase [Pareuzebyella sediminis]|uniref:sugar transferase n=1 Tax=Pareuzebyella sediminis TaxID=2607998 RepID=UPI0011EE1EBD|nr:sugar transferase [Pareuzebyella sediminis]